MKYKIIKGSCRYNKGYPGKLFEKGDVIDFPKSIIECLKKGGIEFEKVKAKKGK